MRLKALFRLSVLFDFNRKNAICSIKKKNKLQALMCVCGAQPTILEFNEKAGLPAGVTFSPGMSQIMMSQQIGVIESNQSKSGIHLPGWKLRD